MILKPLPRRRFPKPLTKHVESIKKHVDPWQPDDVFYPKAFLRHLASKGVDISQFNAIQGAIDEGDESRAIVSTAALWDEIDSNDGKIIVPYTFHVNFPWQSEVNIAVASMNLDLGCVKVMQKLFADFGREFSMTLINMLFSLSKFRATR